MLRRLLIAALALPFVSTGPKPCVAADKPRMLFLTQSQGFRHRPVTRKEGERSSAELAMMQLAKDSGQFTVVCSQNAAADITRANLDKFDIVAFYTTGKLPIAEDDLKYFLGEWLHKKGHGFLGFHSATDTFKDYEPYWDMVGGTFNGHPWGQNSKVTIKVHNTKHPTMRPYKPSFEYQDEIYQYRNWQPKKVHVLMSLDMENTETKRPYHVPVAWCKQVGDGRMFYNNLGHREETWKHGPFLKSIVNAVRWIDGQVEGDARPNPKVSAKHHEDSKRHAEAAGVSAAALEAQKKAQAARRAAREKKKANNN